MTTLVNWTFKTTDNYVAPECSNIILYGETQNHPSFPDGSKVSTGPVVVSGTEFMSQSGRKWTLGQPDADTQLEQFHKRFNEIDEGRTKSGNPFKFGQNR